MPVDEQRPNWEAQRKAARGGAGGEAPPSRARADDDDDDDDADDEEADDEDAEPEPAPVGRKARTNAKLPPPVSKPRRSAGHIRSAAKSLRKEAGKILASERKRTRIPKRVVTQLETSVATIDQLLATPEPNLVELEHQAELVDELLHQHASFARKSPLRETLENIAIAIGVALAVRSCVYEPFKIPSGSMMPTLRAGDHIFVNKFAYGVQIPMTTDIVGEDWLRSIERGDVIVFRYPLDENEDFIKRVIALPGDTLRVSGDRRKLELMRAGEDEFVEITRERQHDRKCLAENSAEPIDNCSVYHETLDGRTYEVRYRDDLRTSDPSMRSFVVPEGHLLVMGDNRNASHDSLAWQVSEDAVAAEGLLSRVDVRDITGTEGRVEVREGFDAVTANDDARRDRVRYITERSSVQHGLSFETWRSPPFAQHVAFEAIALAHGATEVVGFETLLEGAKGIGPRERERLLEVGSQLGEIYRGVDPSSYEVVFRSPDGRNVFTIQCGRGRCMRWSDLATRIDRVIGSWQENPDYDARELLIRETGESQTHPGRGNVEERYLERRFGAEGQGVRVRAWRNPSESLPLLRDAALAEFGAGPVAELHHEKLGVPLRELASSTDLPDGSALVELDESGWAAVVADEDRGMLAVLECGRKRCKNQQDMLELAQLVAGRFGELAAEGERFGELLGQADVGGLPEVPVEPLRSYYWDRVHFEGRVLDDSHSLTLFVEMDPSAGLDAALSAAKDRIEGTPEPVAELGPGAFHALGPLGHQVVFAVPETKLVVELSCRTGLCSDRQIAIDLALRAQEKGRDPENFVQKDVMRPRPFVPRGNVKGEAEVIWWPTSRFWKKIE